MVGTTCHKKEGSNYINSKSAYWLTTHTYGIKMPKTVQEALNLDKENGNTLWYDAIAREMKIARVAIEEWKGKENEILPGYQKIKCHTIFEIKHW